MPLNIPKGIDPGSYPAVLEAVSDGDPTKYGPTRKWHWLVEANGEVQSLVQMTSANLGPGSKGFRMLTALLGRAPAAGEAIEEPTGKRVTLVIKANAKGYATVDEVLPFEEPQQTLPGVPR